MAGRSTGQGREASRRRHHPQSTRNVAHFLRAAAGLGLRDAPTKTLIFPGDFPQADEPLPKFLDDPKMEKFTAALASDPDPRRRVMVEILAQTGIRVGELSGLDDKAVTLLGDTFSLRIPVGKLHNDRYVPIGPELVRLITDYQKFRGPSRSGAWSNETMADPLTAAPFIATSNGWPSVPASVTSIPTSSATHSPPE